MASWMKAVLISTGFVAIAMHLKALVPMAVDFSQSPILLSSVLTWLRPPYLYVITNVIIIVIGVSSTFYRSTVVASHDGKDHYEVSSTFYRSTVVASHDGKDHYEVSYSGENKFQTDHQNIVQQAPLRRRTETKDAEFSFVAEISQSIIVKEPEVVYEEKERPVLEATARVEKEIKCLVVVAKSENQPPAEKPLVSARIGQRKLVKATPAVRNSMRALKVAKPRRNETLENTWKMIMEGKSALPLTSYYRKPDTFGLSDSDSKETKRAVLKKAETFGDKTNYYQSAALPPLPPVKVKKVKVTRSRDELNRRVETFIKKCNDERFASMRLDKEMNRRGLSL